MQFSDGDIVIVSALNRSPFYRHHAVYWGGKFYHFNESGMHIDTPHELIDVPHRQIIGTMHGTQTAEQMHNFVETHAAHRYNALTFNCEHWAYGMATGVQQSPTIRGAVVFVVAVVAVVTIGILTIKQTIK